MNTLMVVWFVFVLLIVPICGFGLLAWLLEDYENELMSHD